MEKYDPDLEHQDFLAVFEPMWKNWIRDSRDYERARQLITRLAQTTREDHKAKIAQALIDLGDASSIAQEDVLNESLQSTPETIRTCH